MTRKEVKRIIERQKELNDFLEGSMASISFDLAGVPIIIFKEWIGTRYYYRRPWSIHSNYATAQVIMTQVIPILSEMLEKRRIRNLIAPGNIIKATPRYK